MSRFLKVLGVVGLSSVYLMQAPCTTVGGGVSILPNVGGLIVGQISALTGGLI
jgi:hypothetical protein